MYKPYNNTCKEQKNKTRKKRGKENEKITKKEINERINELSKFYEEKVIYKTFIKEYNENDEFEIIAEFITISKSEVVRKYVLFNNRIVCNSYILTSCETTVTEY